VLIFVSFTSLQMYIQVLVPECGLQAETCYLRRLECQNLLCVMAIIMQNFSTIYHETKFTTKKINIDSSQRTKFLYEFGMCVFAHAV